jgi:hypothetical protein
MVTICLEIFVQLSVSRGKQQYDLHWKFEYYENGCNGLEPSKICLCSECGREIWQFWNKNNLNKNNLLPSILQKNEVHYKEFFTQSLLSKNYITLITSIPLYTLLYSGTQVSITCCVMWTSIAAISSLMFCFNLAIVLGWMKLQLLWCLHHLQRSRDESPQWMPQHITQSHFHCPHIVGVAGRNFLLSSKKSSAYWHNQRDGGVLCLS